MGKARVKKDSAARIDGVLSILMGALRTVTRKERNAWISNGYK
jgi:hypothetical protein